MTAVSRLGVCPHVSAVPGAALHSGHLIPIEGHRLGGLADPAFLLSPSLATPSQLSQMPAWRGHGQGCLQLWQAQLIPWRVVQAQGWGRPVPGLLAAGCRARQTLLEP